MNNGMSLKSILMRNTSAQMVGQVFVLTMGLMTTMILSRHLGVYHFGEYHYIFAFFAFFLMINDFGIETAVIREASQRKEEIAEIIGSIYSFKIALATLSLIGAWLVITFVPFATDLRNALYIGSLILPLTALRLPSVIFQINLDLKLPNVLGIISRGCGFLMMLAAVSLGYKLKGLIAVFVASEFIFTALLLFFSFRSVRPVMKIRFDILKTVMRGALSIGACALMVTLINRADFIMLQRMTDSTQVGLYSAAYRFTNLVELLPLMVMASVYPMMSKLVKEDLIRLKKLYKKILMLFVFFSIPLGLMLHMVAPLVVKILFGSQFLDAVGGLRILIWASVFLYMAITSGNLLIAGGWENINLYIFTAAALVNLSLNFIWIPKWGFQGAAAATVTSFLIIFISQSIAAAIFWNRITKNNLEVKGNEKI